MKNVEYCYCHFNKLVIPITFALLETQYPYDMDGGKTLEYKQTDERVMVQNRLRVVYMHRGTKYVKCVQSKSGYKTLTSALQ